MQRYYFLLENMYRAMIIFWLTCLEGYPRTSAPEPLSDLMRPILSFNEDESLYQIWEKMLEKREHISIIVDEYGVLRGVVSMEDVIETMTGVEIVDEDDVAVDMQVLAREKSRMMLQK